MRFPNLLNSKLKQVLVLSLALFLYGCGQGESLVSGSSTSSTSSLISNGDFSSATDAWSGNGFFVVDGANFADVATAGNSYDVNLSNVIDLQTGSSYTLTFKAKGTVGRTIIAGIGLNSAPFTNVTETVTLTADWQVFTYTFTNIGFGDTDSRVLFDMGADVGEVYIDDVTLVKYGELLSNGDFSSETDAWSGNAFLVVDGANFANVATAGNSYDVNLSNVIDLQTGSSYTLRFRAKGTAGRTIIAGIGLNEAPYTNAVQTATLTADWQVFTYTFTNLGFGGTNSRVLFDFGADIGEVFIDDVSLVKTGELLINGDFSSETAAWSGNAFVVVDGANYANVATAGNAYDVNLSNVTNLQSGSSYTLRFRAKGTAGRTIIAGIGLNEAPFTNATQTATLTADWQVFTYTFTSIGFGSANSRVLFDLGADVGEVFIDDVSLVEIP